LFTGRMTVADAPLELTLDMPGDGPPLGGTLLAQAQIVIPPLPSLVHDTAFFKSIKGRGFHGGLLDGLAEFYVEKLGVRERRTRAAAAARRQG